MFGGKKRERRLEEAGQTAPARVVKLHRGGSWWVGSAHGGPNVQRTNCRLTLEVQPPSEPTFETELKTHFRTESVPSEGDVIDVVYDPASHDNVAVAGSPSWASCATRASSPMRSFRRRSRSCSTGSSPAGGLGRVVTPAV